MLQITRRRHRNADIVTSIAKRRTAQESDLLRVVARYVEKSLRRDRLTKWSNFFDGVVVIDAVICEAVALHAPIQVWALQIVAHVAGNTCSAQRRAGTWRRFATDRRRKNLIPVAVHHVVIAQWPKSFRHKIRSGTR